MRCLATFLSVFFCSAAISSESEVESLALRRICDFWQEGEYPLAKSQMQEFLSLYPESSYCDMLHSALGDLFLREQNYKSALESYSQIKDPSQAKKVFINKSQCLFHLSWYANLADECEAYLKASDAEQSTSLQATYLLAIALYQQCLDPSKDSAFTTQCASRAKPYFETLSKSELSSEVAEAFAHLLCLLKEFEAASNIYIDLAKNSPKSEEFLFQAAVLQSKYDPNKALASFQDLALGNSAQAPEASYNLLVLYVEQEKFSQVIEEKDTLIRAIPKHRLGLAHFLIGKSFFALKQYEEASTQFNAFLNTSESPELMKPALMHLIEASLELENLDLMTKAIEKFKEKVPNDEEIGFLLLKKSELLKKQKHYDLAASELKSLIDQYPNFSDRSFAYLELTAAHIEMKNWQEARNVSLAFLKEYPSHEHISYGWKYLATASNELAQEKASFKPTFVGDITSFLEVGDFLQKQERLEWEFILAKTQYELQMYAEARQLLESMHPKLETPLDLANAKLLLALIYRDDSKDLETYCEFAELALINGATLLKTSDQHIALFNAYLSRNHFPLAASHLYTAFIQKAAIQLSNIIWLSHYYCEEFAKGKCTIEIPYNILSHFFGCEFTISSENLYLEPLLIEWAKLCEKKQDRESAIKHLKNLEDTYQNFKESSWKCKDEAQLYLGELYLQSGNETKALELFEKVSSSCQFRNRFVAKATLLYARMLSKSANLEDPNCLRAIHLLKNLCLQKNIENEPTHLEAALDYINLMSQNDSAKKMSLLIKTKADFQSEEDLLSKDYHFARKSLPIQDIVYCTYMLIFDMEIAMLEKQFPEKQLEVKEKITELLEKIQDETLIVQVKQRLRSCETIK